MSLSAREPGAFHWAATLRHEFSHVYVLSMTQNRVPRWFTEGLAVHEEGAASPDWDDRLTPDVIGALAKKRLLPVLDLDRGFVRPEYPSAGDRLATTWLAKSATTSRLASATTLCSA